MKHFVIAVLSIILVGSLGLAIVQRPAADDTIPPMERDDPPASEHHLKAQLANATIDVDEVVPVLSPDAIPAILPDETADLFVTAAAAEELGIKPSVRVIGVTLNGDSRAYPLPFLSKHEIVNDVVGDRPVAVTW